MLGMRGDNAVKGRGKAVTGSVASVTLSFKNHWKTNTVALCQKQEGEFGP